MNKEVYLVSAKVNGETWEPLTQPILTKESAFELMKICLQNNKQLNLENTRIDVFKYSNSLNVIDCEDYTIEDNKGGIEND